MERRLLDLRERVVKEVQREREVERDSIRWELSVKVVAVGRSWWVSWVIRSWRGILMVLLGR